MIISTEMCISQTIIIYTANKPYYLPIIYPFSLNTSVLVQFEKPYSPEAIEHLQKVLYLGIPLDPAVSLTETELKIKGIMEKLDQLIPPNLSPT